MAKRICKFRKPDGEPCGSPPLRDGEFCLWHDPAHAEEVAAARQIGGSRRKRERTLAVAFDFEGTGTVEQIRRLVDIAILETLALDNSINRNRTLAYLGQTAVKLLEVGQYAEQLASVQATLEPRLLEVRRR